MQQPGRYGPAHLQPPLLAQSDAYWHCDVCPAVLNYVLKSLHVSCGEPQVLTSWVWKMGEVNSAGCDKMGACANEAIDKFCTRDCGDAAIDSNWRGGE